MEGDIAAHTRELLVAYGKKAHALEQLSAEDLEELLDTVVDADSALEIQHRRVMCLHWAAERGYAELLERLLGIGNNIEGLSEAQKGATPLAAQILKSPICQ